MDNHSAKRALNNVGPYKTYVSPDWAQFDSPETFNPPARAIRAETAGTVTVEMPGGAGKVLQFKAGETRYGIFLGVSAATAGGLERGL